MKSVVVVASTVQRAEDLMNARRVPRRYWRLARHPVDLAGVSAGRVLVDSKILDEDYGVTEERRLSELLDIVSRIEKRDGTSCEWIKSPPPPPAQPPS